MEEPTLVTTVTDAVAVCTINRPKSLNALNTEVLQSLLLETEKIAADPAIRAMIITGAGEKSFVAGADIAAMADLGPRPIAEYVELGQRTMRALELCPKPVLAAVNGYALGGGMELALACDIIFASAHAKLGQPEVNLGIIPGFGGTQRLMLRCGAGVARRLIYSGEIISADEAQKIGLVEKVFSAETLLAETRAYALQIAAKAPLAVAKAKQVLRASQENLLLSGLRLEVEGFLELFRSADRQEGMAAFLQKRQPVFKGN